MDAYGGRSTTLELTATSRHPESTSVQLPLMELLIGRGAIIDGPDGGSAVNGCAAGADRQRCSSPTESGGSISSKLFQ
jgi:hypothetical protein